MCYSIVRMYSMYVRSARRKLCWEDRGERILFLSGLGQTDRLTNEVEWKTKFKSAHILDEFIQNGTLRF